MSDSGRQKRVLLFHRFQAAQFQQNLKEKGRSRWTALSQNL